VSNRAVSFLEGITNAVDAGTRVEYDLGSDYTDTVHFGGIWAAGNADITVAVIGLTPVYEGEEGDAFLAAKGGDKPDMSLPAAHIAFMKALRKANKKPIIAVVTAGSAVDISAIEPYADAIILAWYPGEQGGNALADILFGRVSPAGRLPVTFYQSFADVPAYDNYAMKGRTYRYFNGKVQYPFGYGLSYTSFAYEWQKMPAGIRTVKDSISFSIKVKNTGSMDGDEVVQVYVEYPPMDRMPLKELKAFKRVHVNAGGEATVQISIPAADLQKWDLASRSWKLYPGSYTIFAGGNSTDKKIVATIKTGGKK
jgi:beta-glucosidase